MLSTTPPSGHSIELQISVLRNLPTPVLVLSPNRIVAYANRAAERTFGSEDPIQSTGLRIRGLALEELGIHPLHDQRWEAILDGLVGTPVGAEDEDEGTIDIVHEVEVEVSNNQSKTLNRYFRISLSTLSTNDGTHSILSFETPRHDDKKPYQRQEDLPSSPVSELSVRPDTTTPKSSLKAIRDITRIKKAVFDSCNVVAFILSVDEKFYLPNKRTRDLLGDIMGGPEGCDGLSFREKLEIWDEHFVRRLEPQDFPGLRLVRARKPFEDYRCGFTHMTNGNKIVMSVTGECLYDDETGEFLGGLCWCSDLQEHSEFLKEQKIKELDSHETICNLMPHMVWTTTPDGICDWFSKRWYEFTGMSEEESVGLGFAAAIHPEDLPILIEKWDENRQHGMECDVEVRYRRRDGIYKWALARACPYTDENGVILKWYGTTTDIHELVMARIEAARNKLQMLTVLAHAEVNLFSINENRVLSMMEGGMLWESDCAEHDPRKKSTMVGKDAIEVARSTQAGGIPVYEKNVLDILSGKIGVAQSEDRIGEHVYRTRLVADLEHDSEDGAQKPAVKGVLGLSIDVTDLNRRTALEQDNTRLAMEEQAAKDSNNMKSQFLANMSHELRTPTAGVIGMVELLSEDPTLTPEQREYINSIQLSGKALLTIVNDILDFSKIESGRLDIEEVPFNIHSIIDELCKLLGMFAHQKGLDFVYDNDMEEALEVLGDSGRTRQVLSNLLTNALKFTKEGSVKLTVTAIPILSNLLGEETLKVKFLVEDTGIGIEKHILDKLFRPFSQGDASTARLYGGTGLGLTISKNLASLMHGSITLTSTPNCGSTATFLVPFKVSSWCRNPRFASSPPNPGFRCYNTLPHPSTQTTTNKKRSTPQKTPLFSTPIKPTIFTHPFSHSYSPSSPICQSLLNQQIGTTATYTPISPPPPHPSLKTSTSAPSSFSPTLPLPSLTKEQRSKTHILIVEDNPINQTIALRNIRNLGFPCTAVWNGSEALSYLLSPPSPKTPIPTIILMDIQMPIMDGYEATRILRSGSHNNISDIRKGQEDGDKVRERDRINDLKTIPIIAMTASAIQGDKEKCHDAGMDDYLSKPVEKKRLEEMLIKWAGRRRD